MESQIRNKQNPLIRFSSEEIYNMFGQYDTFVTLEFHYNSEAYKLYAPTLMGTFLYTLNERETLEQRLASVDIPQTNEYIRFIPSQMEDLSAKQLVDLDKKGILNSDIAMVSALNLPRENRFVFKGKKDIPNTIKINFDASDTDWNLFKMGYYNSRLKNKEKLILEEQYEFWGLQLFYNPQKIDIELNRCELIDESTGNIKESIRYYQLSTKLHYSDLTEQENNEFKELVEKRTAIKWGFLYAELKRSGQKLGELYYKHKILYENIIHITTNFKDEVLIPYNFPIWWDFERFIHIYLGHVKETKVRAPSHKGTVFQYKFQDVRRVIIGVIKSIYNEVEAHFQGGQINNFRRMGSRSVYYDGIYYRIEIDSSGRLIAFHPFNYNADGNDTE